MFSRWLATTSSDFTSFAAANAQNKRAANTTFLALLKLFEALFYALLLCQIFVLLSIRLFFEAFGRFIATLVSFTSACSISWFIFNHQLFVAQLGSAFL